MEGSGAVRADETEQLVDISTDAKSTTAVEDHAETSPADAAKAEAEEDRAVPMTGIDLHSPVASLASEIAESMNAFYGFHLAVYRAYPSQAPVDVQRALNGYSYQLKAFWHGDGGGSVVGLLKNLHNIAADVKAIQRAQSKGTSDLTPLVRKLRDRVFLGRHLLGGTAKASASLAADWEKVAGLMPSLHESELHKRPAVWSGQTHGAADPLGWMKKAFADGWRSLDLCGNGDDESNTSPTHNGTAGSYRIAGSPTHRRKQEPVERSDGHPDDDDDFVQAAVEACNPEGPAKAEAMAVHLAKVDSILVQLHDFNILCLDFLDASLQSPPPAGHDSVGGMLALAQTLEAAGPALQKAVSEVSKAALALREPSMSMSESQDQDFVQVKRPQHRVPPARSDYGATSSASMHDKRDHGRRGPHDQHWGF